MKFSLNVLLSGLLFYAIVAIGDESIPAPRLALVIGNENYRLSDYHIRDATNSSEDAKLIAQALNLETLGFDTIVALDLSYEDIDRYVDELIDKRIPEATIGNVRPVVFFYFAGHGFYHDDNQWIVGVGAEKDKESLILNSFSLKNIENKLNKIARTFFFIDACRTSINEVSSKANDDSRRVGLFDSEKYGTSHSDNLRKGYTFYSTKRGAIARGKSKISSDYSPYAFFLNSQFNSIDARSTLNDVVDSVKTRVTSAIREQRPILESESSGRLYLNILDAYKIPFHKQRLKSALNSRDKSKILEYILNNPGGGYNYLAYNFLDDLLDTHNQQNNLQ